METSLHRTLKNIYAGVAGQSEVKLDSFRIDAICGDQLVEIQHGSLAAIRPKIKKLLAAGHDVRVVKPIVARKRLVKRKAQGKAVASERMSPSRGCILDIFHELIYFRDVFPHPNLTLDVPLVSVEEWRYPSNHRRRKYRKKFAVEDQFLLEIIETRQFQTKRDLLKLIPRNMPSLFTTQHLAEALQVDRWFAQRIAYCLRHMKALKTQGKQRNAILYRFAA
ncbi:MAG: hypothetical protein R3C28_33495 [Pirellulaceae bacterium]